MKRRLAAILAADVVGFSRLMGTNEVGTLNALNRHRSELIDGAIARNSGRIFKLMGDGILAEFGSVVDAVTCALEIQRAMPSRNADVPEDRRMFFRIGVNLGDILVQGDDLLGDGVNVAARLEALAQPGGISVSGTVHDQVRKKLDLRFEPAGEQQLKNIEEPVPVFHVVLDTGSAELGPPSAAQVRPSIAVLPFSNMSDEPEQEFFADGITEDIITDLSKISGLFVVGRNSVFVYKGKAVNLQAAARELGVRYLLEGSVRKAGQRVRITGQLIDGVTGGHIWADRYDRDLIDIFALQDDIASTIIDQLQIRLLPSETDGAKPSATRNVEAYNYYLRGRQLYHMRLKPLLQSARLMFFKAVECDPDYGRAYAGIADCDSFLESWYGVKVPMEDILANADKALSLVPDLAEAHAARGLGLQIAGLYTDAEAAYNRAFAADPQCYEAHHNCGRLYRVLGDFERSIHHFTRALEIDPEDYRSPLLISSIYHARNDTPYQDRFLNLGLNRAEEAIAKHPDRADALELGAATLAASGRHAEARDWVRRALEVNPDVSTVPRYNVVCAYSLLGELDKALDLLEVVFSNVGREGLAWMRNDNDLDPLRHHPRFEALFELVLGEPDAAPPLKTGCPEGKVSEQVA